MKQVLKDLRWGTKRDTVELGMAVLCGAALLALCGCVTDYKSMGYVDAGVPIVHYAKFKEPVNPITEKFTRLHTVNTFVNAFPYKRDVSDVWQTPAQFYKNGGDCEDYALAKYALIKANGLGEPRLFLVFDRFRQEPHMVVLVGNQVLDNQNPQITSFLESTLRYQYLAEVETK